MKNQVNQGLFSVEVPDVKFEKKDGNTFFYNHVNVADVGRIIYYIAKGCRYVYKNIKRYRLKWQSLQL